MTGMNPNVPLPVIGVVRSQYAQTEHTPIQSSLNRAGQASVEIAEQYAEGLEGLAAFDYAWLITWLHRPHDRAPGPVPLRQVPFLLRAQQRRLGIFATRGPRRVNPIGLSLVALTEVTGRVITFAGVDLLDGTPVLDIKPYVTRFDRPPGEPRCGWVDEVPVRDGTTPAGLAE
ncbi:MAG TPA: tRNA (N6-threonylcarbamoyladenosine(37)-N6)-methyltransferase TrmO [Streptosporangiaceae bacterium]|jgi:tRNA-Thr(GGU) m(6)t(6)A37 methyltransferase TsaA